jgi:hypothetical protein
MAYFTWACVLRLRSGGGLTGSGGAFACRQGRAQPPAQAAGSPRPRLKPACGGRHFDRRSLAGLACLLGSRRAVSLGLALGRSRRRHLGARHGAAHADVSPRSCAAQAVSSRGAARQATCTSGGASAIAVNAHVVRPRPCSRRGDGLLATAPRGDRAEAMRPMRTCPTPRRANPAWSAVGASQILFTWLLSVCCVPAWRPSRWR